MVDALIFDKLHWQGHVCTTKIHQDVPDRSDDLKIFLWIWKEYLREQYHSGVVNPKHLSNEGVIKTVFQVLLCLSMFSFTSVFEFTDHHKTVLVQDSRACMNHGITYIVLEYNGRSTRMPNATRSSKTNTDVWCTRSLCYLRIGNPILSREIKQLRLPTPPPVFRISVSSLKLT